MSIAAAAYTATSSGDDGSLLLGWAVLAVLVASCAIACLLLNRYGRHPRVDTDTSARGLPYLLLVLLPMTAECGHRAVTNVRASTSASTEDVLRLE